MSAGGPFEFQSTYSPYFDTLIAEGGETLHEKATFDKDALLNGTKVPRRLFPQLRGFTRKKSLVTAKLSELGVRSGQCPFCRIKMLKHEFSLEDHPDEMPSFRAQASLSNCENCQHWEHVELRQETYDIRADLFDKHRLAIVNSKTREFDTVAPAGTLEEIAQWFRRHPYLYNSVHPSYLEKLVAKVFEASGAYADVKHVGRPDDGGVDVVLVESETSTWLVQVKRREHPDSVEPVSTVRNLLGTLVLGGSEKGIVVSTADHFSYRAREAVDIAARKDFVVRLIDRRAFDRLLATRLPKAPWKEVMARINDDRVRWFGSPDGLPAGEVVWSIEKRNAAREDGIDPEQFTLF
ncbi:restriction endonuclease [Saccharothrix sp. NPDC042600]|uniref:restriction endonuclease n=1 Tax=Saccharothrix TaxID=2071 RepID=UPI00340E5EDD|nr:hypothetical protein GCM10017745_67060 [Saccharothrix mutabilis subsp. capreolus]